MRRPLRKPHGLAAEDINNWKQPCAYTIFNDGAVCKALNAVTGVVDFRDTDAATVMNAALDATYAGKVFVQEGKYQISQTIIIPNQGTEFCGNMWRGSDATGDYGLHLDDSVDDDMLLVNNLKCYVHDLFMYGNEGNNVTSSGVTTLNDGALDIHLDRCYIFDFNNYGVHISGGAGIVTNVYVEYCNDSGFYSGDTGQKMMYIGCGSWANQTGFENTKSNCSYVGCRASTNITNGFYLDNYSHHTTIDGCWLDRNGYHGIVLHGAEDNIISNNMIYAPSQNTANTYDGICLEPSGGSNCTDCVISGNHISNAETNKHRYGINLTDANQSDNVICCNILTDATTGQYNIPAGNISPVNGTGTEASNGEEPVGAWPIGTIVSFTDTGDSSGDGSYYKILAGTWVKLT